MGKTIDDESEQRWYEETSKETGIPVEELKRRRKELREGLGIAGPDDPIYRGGLAISHVQWRPSTETSASGTDGEDQSYLEKDAQAWEKVAEKTSKQFHEFLLKRLKELDKK